jgi:hypothetical protein
VACPAAAGDWTFYRHDLSGTGNAGEALTVDQAKALEVRRFVMSGGVNVSNPIVANGTLFYTGGDYIHAVDLGTFKERWRNEVSVKAPFPQCVTISEQSPIGAPAVVGSTVFMPGADGVVMRSIRRAAQRSGLLRRSRTRTDSANSSGAARSRLNGKIYVGVSSIVDCTLVPGRLVQLDQATSPWTGTWWADTQHRVGGGIWTQQAYDPVTNRLFATTGTIGDGFTTAEQPWADAFVAIDPDTMQTVDWLSPIPNDTFSADVDFGASPTLYDSPDGTHFIAAADKNGFVYAADRDHLSNGVL